MFAVMKGGRFFCFQQDIICVYIYIYIFIHSVLFFAYPTVVDNFPIRLFEVED